MANIAPVPEYRMRELISLQLVVADRFKLVEWEKTGSGKPFDLSGLIGLSGTRRRDFIRATVVGYRIITKFQPACVNL